MFDYYLGFLTGFVAGLWFMILYEEKQKRKAKKPAGYNNLESIKT